MAWRLIEVPDNDADSDITDSELVGAHILLSDNCGEPFDERNVYFRVWSKIQPKVKAALKKQKEE